MMANVFYNIGKFSASNPWMPCIMSVFITALLSTGIYNLHLETDPISLWVSPNSRSYTEQMTFSDSFGPFYRINQFMLIYRNESESNIFQKEALHVVHYIQQIINNHNYTSKGQQITWDSLCFKPILGQGCLAPSPMDFWLQDLNLLNQTPDIQRTTLCIEPVDPKSSKMICADSNGIPVIREAVFGGMYRLHHYYFFRSCEEKQNDTQPCDHCWISAKTLQVTYLLNNDEFTATSKQHFSNNNIDAMIWEKEVFEDAVSHFNNADFDYLDKLLPKTNEYVDHKVLNQYKMVYMCERSVPDQITSETNQNAWIVILSYLLMFLYVSFAISRFPSKVESGFLLGAGGIYIVIISMVSSIGFVSYLNMGMTMISLEVIPFLLLAIGVDNMFLITNTFNSTNNAKNLPDQFGKALKSVGPSITTAALCESLAFLMGSMTKMPALQSFCIQAAFGVLIDYLLQITTFIAFLSWDQQRKQKGQMDCLFCVKSENYKIKGERELVKKFVATHYVPLFNKLYCQVLTYLIFAGLFTLSVFGCLNLQIGLNEQVSFSEGSPIYNYLGYEAKYIAAGPPAYLVLKNLDYSDPKDLKLATDLGNSLSQLNDTVQPPVYSWVSTFQLFISPNADWVDTCHTKDIASYTFGEQLKRFLDVQVDSDCCQSYGICGQTFQMDLNLDDDYNVLVSRLRFQHRPIHNSAGYILSFQQTRQTVDKLLQGRLTGDKSIYPYSLFYMFYDQYSYIRAVAINNVLLAIATTFILIAIIQDSWTAFISVISIFLIGFNLIGMVWACNVVFGGFQIEINAISVVNLVTCIGLSVEFCVHIVIKFMNTQGNRKDRINKAVVNIGSSVFIGIITTKFIGVIVLGFAPSNLFKLYYFRMYILMVILGAFNGLVLLPITLNLIGPNFNKLHVRPITRVESSQESAKKKNKMNSIILSLLMVLTIARGPGDLSKAGVLKKKNPFFGLTLHPDDGKEIKRRLLNEDETLDPEKKLPFKEAILTIAEFLETKAEKTQGQKGLQKRIAREYLVNKQIQQNEDVFAKIIYDSISDSDILFFANKWTGEMYFDLLRNLSMYRDGMSVEDAIRDAETFGLSFQTWKLLKNDEHSFDDDYFDDSWNSHHRSLQDNDDWVQKMEQDMQQMKEDHEKKFGTFDIPMHDIPNNGEGGEFPFPPPPMPPPGFDRLHSPEFDMPPPPNFEFPRHPHHPRFHDIHQVNEEQQKAQEEQ